MQHTPDTNSTSHQASISCHQTHYSKNLRSITLSKQRKVAKVSQSRAGRQDQEPQSNIVKLASRNYKRIEMIPRNTAQEQYIHALYQHRMVFAVGPAGTGKSMLAVLMAIKCLREGQITKIVLSRPAVSVDEQHGFLPGDLNAKMEPWTRPIFDVFEEYYGLPETKRMLDEGIIEVAPLGFMRGRTFKHAFVILDEAQNTTIEQMKMALTRIGEGSRMVITGDLKQHDRGYSSNGLKDFLEKLAKANTKSMSVCTFTRDHIERDPLVTDVLNVYNED